MLIFEILMNHCYVYERKHMLKSLLMEANRFIDFKRSDFDLPKASKPKLIAFGPSFNMNKPIYMSQNEYPLCFWTFVGSSLTSVFDDLRHHKFVYTSPML
jgi:hypothetical protein